MKASTRKGLYSKFRLREVGPNFKEFLVFLEMMHFGTDFS
jgi:hypothetical protein